MNKQLKLDFEENKIYNDFISRAEILSDAPYFQNLIQDTPIYINFEVTDIKNLSFQEGTEITLVFKEGEWKLKETNN